MGLFAKIFGGKTEKRKQSSVDGLLKQILEKGGFGISYDLKILNNQDTPQTLKVDFYGGDEELFTEKDGNLLDSFQLFIKRYLQHQFPGDTTNVVCDCGDFREKANQSLVDLADHLKKKALDQGRSVYLRALSPKDRKVVHQFLATDKRVRSRSVGDGLYKKIKIYPNTKENSRSNPL